MNRTVMEDIELIDAHDILRVALIDYADNPEAASHNMARALVESKSPNYYVEHLATSLGRDIEVTARYVDGETPSQQLAIAQAKLENYRKTLARIAEGDRTPMLLARAVLDGAEWNVR